MSTSSSTPVYLLSGICVAIGAYCFISPKGEYERFGIPLEGLPAASGGDKKARSSSTAAGNVSPLIYVKGTRELCFGLNFAALQYQGLYAAVTTCLAVYSLAALIDGFVIWSRFPGKALGHLAFGVGFAAWAAWRNGSL